MFSLRAKTKTQQKIQRVKEVGKNALEGLVKFKDWHGKGTDGVYAKRFNSIQL